MMKNGNNDKTKKFSSFSQKDTTEKSELKEEENLNTNEPEIPKEVQILMEDYKKKVPFQAKDFQKYLSYKGIDIKFK